MPGLEARQHRAVFVEQRQLAVGDLPGPGDDQRFPEAAIQPIGKGAGGERAHEPSELQRSRDQRVAGADGVAAVGASDRAGGVEDDVRLARAGLSTVFTSASPTSFQYVLDEGVCSVWARGSGLSG